jgi:LysM repeat protein
MKIPSILTRNISRKQKLRATTARRSRSLGLPDEMDYEQMSEPNMKLSRALLIVLVLHVVAVAGIVAFNTIKTRENMPSAIPAEAAAPETTAAPETVIAATTPAAPNEVAKSVAPPETKPVEKASAPMASSVKDSGKTYTVVKGDNPVTIARRLKVSEAELLELNQITDPRKLQINQKLRIPARSTNSSKHSSD